MGNMNESRKSGLICKCGNPRPTGQKLCWRCSVGRYVIPVHPGEHIKDEIKERGWTQATLAEIMGRPVQVINEIIKGKKSITPLTAKQLALAFDTSAHMWLELQNAYNLAQ